MRNSIPWALALIATLSTLPADAARGQTVGVQAIGLAAWSDTDISKLSELLVRAGGAVEVGYLPFEFKLDVPYNDKLSPDRDPPFLQAGSLLRQTLPRINGSLTLTTHLYFRHVDDTYQPPFQWSALRRKPDGDFVSSTQDDRAFRTNYQRRCRRNAAFLNTMYAWAYRNGLSGRLKLITVPELEDSAPSRADFNNAIRFIAEAYQSAGATTEFRRCVGIGNLDRVKDMAFEQHGSVSLIANLGAGEVYSNDGETIKDRSGQMRDALDITNPSAFNNYLSQQRNGVRRGVSTLFWRRAYNVGRKDGAPYERGTLRPFDDPAESSALLQVLKAR